jgi:hypothetical protein
MACVTFDKVDLLDRTGDRNIERVDEEFVNLKGLIGLIAGAPIFKITFEIVLADPIDNLQKLARSFEMKFINITFSYSSPFAS